MPRAGDVIGDGELGGHMPSGLIEDHDDVGAGIDSGADLGHLENGVAAMARHLGADLFQLLTQPSYLPVFDPLCRYRRTIPITGNDGFRSNPVLHRVRYG